MNVNSNKFIGLLKLIAVLALVISTSACKNSSDVKLGSDSQLGIAIPEAIQLRTLPPDGTLNAYITCGEGSERKAMEVDLVLNTAQATCSGLAPGETSFSIEFEFEFVSTSYGTVTLASATKTISLVAGEERMLNFSVGDYHIPCIIGLSVIGSCQIGA